MLIRLCQFHVIQAIIRFSSQGQTDEDNYDDDDDHTKPKLKQRVKRNLLLKFRELQRCSDRGQWDTYVAKFEAEIDAIVPQEQIAIVKQYFRKNWYNDFWRGKQN